MPKRKLIQEFHCGHYNNISVRSQSSIFGFDLWLCEKCFSNLTLFINSLLRARMDKTAKFDEGFLKNLREQGIFCDSCTQWKMEPFVRVLTYEMEKQRFTDKTSGKTFSHFIIPKLDTWKPKIQTYCQSCWNTISQNRGIIVTTAKAIYIPDLPSIDGAALHLFKDRVDKTDKVFTLVPNDLLKSILSKISFEVEESTHYKALPGESQ